MARHQAQRQHRNVRGQRDQDAQRRILQQVGNRAGADHARHVSRLHRARRQRRVENDCLRVQRRGQLPGHALCPAAARVQDPVASARAGRDQRHRGPVVPEVAEHGAVVAAPPLLIVGQAHRPGAHAGRAQDVGQRHGVRLRRAAGRGLKPDPFMCADHPERRQQFRGRRLPPRLAGCQCLERFLRGRLLLPPQRGALHLQDAEVRDGQRPVFPDRGECDTVEPGQAGAATRFREQRRGRQDPRRRRVFIALRPTRRSQGDIAASRAGRTDEQVVLTGRNPDHAAPGGDRAARRQCGPGVRFQSRDGGRRRDDLLGNGLGEALDPGVDPAGQRVAEAAVKQVGKGYPPGHQTC